MEKDTLITNTFTLGVAGLATMGVIPTLTVISLCVAIVANLLVIWKNLKNDK